MLFERRARLNYFSLAVAIVVQGRVNLTVYRHPADQDCAPLELSDKYSVLVQRLREDNSRPGVMAEFSPYWKLCDLYSEIVWIQECREVHCSMDPATIQRLLHQWETLTVSQLVVFKYSHGNFTIDPARFWVRGTFLARPQTAQSGWRQKIGY